jgi:alkylation response protein AidB-like acyl-CoA dehydrogenase
MTDEDLVPLLVEAGRAGLPDPVSSTAGVAAALLRDHAAAGVAAEWLPRIAAGEVAVGVGFGPGADGGGAPTVAAASSVDVFMLFDRGEVHLVEPSHVQLRPLDSVDGARHLASVDWTPDPATLVVGSGGTATDAGFVATNAAFDRAALGLAAMLVGLGQRMLDMTVAYASERQQFGVPIGSFQAVKHHLADASLDVEFALPLVLRAANSLASDDPEASVHVSMAKAKASEAAKHAAAASLQVHGAIGYTVECDLHLYMKRAWSLAVRCGDAEFHRRRIRPSLIG